MSVLGPPPPDLSPLPAQLFAGLAELLAALDPPLLDRGMTKAGPRDGGVEVVLAHATEIAFSVWVQADAHAVLVGCAAMHEPRDVTGALALIAQLLCGERDVAGYDGRTLRPDFGARLA